MARLDSIDDRCLFIELKHRLKIIFIEFAIGLLKLFEEFREFITTTFVYKKLPLASFRLKSFNEIFKSSMTQIDIYLSNSYCKSSCSRTLSYFMWNECK